MRRSFNMHKILVLLYGLLLFANVSNALEIKPFSAEDRDRMTASGELYFIHFHADWCPTCRAQAKIFEKFATDPEINKKLNTILLVANNDREIKLKQELRIPSQSFLLGFAKGKEISRTVEVTNPDRLLRQLSGEPMK